MTLKVLIEGAIYSIVLGAIVTVSQLFNARLWLNCYPKAIQQRVSPRTKNELILKLLVGIPFMVVMFGYPIYSTLVLKSSLGDNYTFVKGFINMFIIFTCFNVFDLLVLDWWLFCYINPSFLTLKGTKGMKEYKDYKFHFKAALKGLRLSIIYSLIVAIFMLL